MTEIKFMNLELNSLSAKSKNIYEDIFILPKDRRGFAFNSKFMVTPIYFYRIIGLLEENEYYDGIFDLDEKLGELNSLYIRFDHSLDKSFEKGFIERFNRAWAEIERLNMKNPQMMVQIIFNHKLISRIDNNKDSLMKSKLSMLLKIVMNNQKNLNIIKNFCIKIIYWIEKYALKAIASYVYGEMNPKVLYYGEIHRDEIYFLILLSFMGFDILYFHSFSGETFKEIMNIEVYSNCLEYSSKMPLKPFPMMHKIKREETIAYKASKEIDEIIHTSDSGVYRPWQFESYTLIPRPLKTTYDELFILWKEEARFRGGFEVKDNRIYLPNIFAKISGTTEDINIYWEKVNTLKSQTDKVIFIEKIPFTNIVSYKVHQGLLKEDGTFNIEKIPLLREYKLSYLRTSVQNLILTKINELILSTDYFRWNITLELKFKILFTILNLDKKYLDLLQTFDYPFQIPKIVIFDGDENIFNQEDTIILGFLHFVGFDIVILTPTGYNNIENGINPYYYDTHKLEKINFGLTIPKQGNTVKRSLFDFFR